jgi:DNA-binding NarL/FixJ family response regulator
MLKTKYPSNFHSQLVKEVHHRQSGGEIMPKVLIVDAHELMCDSLTYIFESTGNQTEKTFPMPMGEAQLTSRELEVLRLMCKNMNSKEIADELYISKNTVKYHKANILGKTGFKKGIDLVFHIISIGWKNPTYIEG